MPRSRLSVTGQRLCVLRMRVCSAFMSTLLFILLCTEASPAGQVVQHRTSVWDRQIERLCLRRFIDTVNSMTAFPSHQWWGALRSLSARRPQPTAKAAENEDIIYEILGSIGACRPATHIPCVQDATLPHTIHKRIFLAANLKDNEELMPHFILQLLLSIAAMHRDAVFISVYESGSTDLTAEYLLLLRALLQQMNVPHQIVTGGLQREPGQERIAYLAKIRNLATAPMQQGQDGSPPAWPADRLLMLNDVYFCHQGLIRLLRHSSAAIACGIDFFIDPPGGIVLYDLWVMRDAAGRKPVPNTPPYVEHPHSAARFEAGLPIPVTCCWNGIVSIDAAPLAKGVRFRTYGDGECQECEASHLCTDFWQMGYTTMIMDPGVRVAYQPQLARRLYTPDVPLRITSYQDILDAPPADPEQVPKVFTRECCSKKMMTDLVEFEDCTFNALLYAQTFVRRNSFQSKSIWSLDRAQK